MTDPETNSVPPRREIALNIVQHLQDNGFSAFWVGGCVRDLLMGTPPKDYDIATNARPEQVLRLFPSATEVGKAFGVVVVSERGSSFEIATFRSDHPYHDGRRPSGVTFSTPEADAQRRDFTINALFFDPVRKDLLDYVGGRQDIEKRIVRCVGNPDERFMEDHLRMLRAIRFSAVLGFQIDPLTRLSILKHAARVARISPERIRVELLRTLTEAKRPGDALQELDILGVLPAILPEIAAMKGVPQPPEFHPEGDVFLHTVLALNLLPASGPSFPGWDQESDGPALPLLAMSALLHDVGKPVTAVQTPDRIRFNRHAEAGATLAESILRRLCFSSRQIEIITQVVRNHMRFMDVQNMRQSTRRRLAAGAAFPIEIELHRLDCLASHGDLSNHAFLLKFLKEISEERALPKPWITGHEIMAMGIPEGPQIGHWHRRAYEAQLDCRFPDKASLTEWLRREMPGDRAVAGATPES